MEPYQQATEETRRQSMFPIRAAGTALNAFTGAGKTAIGVGAGIIGSKVVNKIIPFLSEFIPTDMALKGLSKVNPHLGKFIKKAESNFEPEEIVDFIKEKIPQEETSKSTSDQSNNPIERISPALHEFILSEVGKGRKATEALNSAKSQGFLKDIEAVSRKVGARLFDVINSFYPSTEDQESLQADPMQAQQMQQMQQMQQPQQAGQGQAQLMAILQKIQQSRGN